MGFPKVPLIRKQMPQCQVKIRQSGTVASEVVIKSNLVVQER